jgi:hypothetical protein
MAKYKSPLLADDERDILENICQDMGIPCDVVERMIVEENKVYGMGRRHLIFESLRALVAEGILREHREEESDDLDAD